MTTPAKTVAAAVAERDASADLARQARNPIADGLDRFKPVIVNLLTGTGTTFDQFSGQVGNAVRARPELKACDPATVLGAVLRCAQVGLPPNDGRNLAHVIPRGGKAEFQLGYGGVIELARRAVPGIKFAGRPVYPNDDFSLDYGRPDALRHEPHWARGMDRGGEPVAWYVRAEWPDGYVDVFGLDRAGVERHRGFSKQADGIMWTQAYDAAALKSVVLEMRRWLPSSAQLAVAIASDETVIDVEDAGTIIHAVDVDELPAPTDDQEAAND